MGSSLGKKKKRGIPLQKHGKTAIHRTKKCLQTSRKKSLQMMMSFHLIQSAFNSCFEMLGPLGGLPDIHRNNTTCQFRVCPSNPSPVLTMYSYTLGDVGPIADNRSHTNQEPCFSHAKEKVLKQKHHFRVRRPTATQTRTPLNTLQRCGRSDTISGR